MSHSRVFKGQHLSVNTSVLHPGALDVDLNTLTLRVHDGSTPGGVELLTGLDHEIVSTFTGTISGTTLTVTGCPDGVIAFNQYIEGAGVLDDTFVTEQLTGGGAGHNGGNGTYRVSRSQNIGPIPMNVAAMYINAAIKLGEGHGIFQQDEHDISLYNLLIGIKEEEATVHIGDINTNGLSLTNNQEYKVDSALNPGTYMAVAKVDTSDVVHLSSGNAVATEINVGGMSSGYGMKLFNGGKTHIPNNLKIGDNTNDSIFAAPLEVYSRLQGAPNNQSSPAGIGLPTYRGTGTIIANDEWGSYLYGSRYRGTINSPLPVKDGDWLMEFGATAFDGANNGGGGEIAFRVDGTVTGSSNPSKIEFYNTKVGDSYQSLGMTLHASQTLEVAGRVQIAGTVPTTNKGAAGDKAGMIAVGGGFLYVCTADYTNGSPTIWTKTALTAW
jgi:hypothetical protein